MLEIDCECGNVYETEANQYGQPEENAVCPVCGLKAITQLDNDELWWNSDYTIAKRKAVCRIGSTIELPEFKPKITPSEKVCNGCYEMLPISEFSKNIGTKDGRQYKCRTCQAKYYAERKKNREG